MLHFQQAYFLYSYDSSVSSLIFSAVAKSSRPLPPQFRIGESPPKALEAVWLMVPYLVKYLTFGLAAISRMKRRLISLARAASAIGIGAVPRATIAFRRLDTITAPNPERAAIRPSSLTTPLMSDSFSPAGPITADCDLGWRSRSRSSVS